MVLFIVSCLVPSGSGRRPMTAQGHHADGQPRQRVAGLVPGGPLAVGPQPGSRPHGSISSNVNGGQNVLNAVAAVIGGTSLFGGRGKMLHAVLGGLMVGVINNGLQLLGLSAAAQLMWTAAVLLVAVIGDWLTRRAATT